MSHTQRQDSLSELRTLLLAPEQTGLRELQERLDNPATRTREIADVLPQAIKARLGDPNLTAALAPTVQEILQSSARRNPRALADALFPVIGPAIRKAISEMFGAMLQSLNRVLDRSLSVEGLKWRWEALRTGRSFGEVALLHTLVYRVEQVLLIHEHTGLLLLHVVAADVPRQDAKLVSGMLSAIRDFVRDSLKLEQNEVLESMKAGPFSFWIETGPEACLVSVVRGTAPIELRRELQAALEIIHRDYALGLAAFDGDSTLFEAARPVLECCLRTQYTQRNGPRPAKPARVVLAAVALIAAAAIVLYVRDEMRWARFLDRLRSEAGIAVIEARKTWDGYYVRGLKDPLAADPKNLLTETGIRSDRFHADWQPFQSVESEFVLQRARMLLRPPTTLGLAMDNGLLTASGSAPENWLADARRLAPLIPGVSGYRESATESDEWRSARDLAREIEAVRIDFPLASPSPDDAGGLQLTTAADAFSRLVGRVRAMGWTVRLRIDGYADRSGTVEINMKLAQARANTVAHAFIQRKIEAELLEPHGIGYGDTRTVVFHVAIARPELPESAAK